MLRDEASGSIKACVGALLIAALVTGGDASARSMRDPSFRGVKRVAILAQYGPAGSVAGGEDSDRLCAEILPLATRGAPVPMACARIGDPLLAQPGTMVLIAQASVTSPSDRVPPAFAVAMRLHWTGGLEPAPIYFGAAPRVVSYSGTSADRAARIGALDAALADVLPWRRQGGETVGRPAIDRE